MKITIPIPQTPFIMPGAKRVFISSPYTIGDKEKNVQVQHEAFDILVKYGYLPFAPLLCHYQNQKFSMDEDNWLIYDLQWLSVCQAVLRLPGESKGANNEVRFAQELGIPVFYDYDSLFADIDTVSTEPNMTLADFEKASKDVDELIALGNELCRLVPGLKKQNTETIIEAFKLALLYINSQGENIDDSISLKTVYQPD